ncbi:MAG: hypothetical protein KDA24_30325, partial [Deltaproteobacteria bacterium]|nr:hypothetical protein [Deltaproteobacteria bacterium]
GELALWLSASGKRLLTFPRADEPELLPRALSVLPHAARTSRRSSITLETIDGEPARTSDRKVSLMESGFVQDYRGLTLEVD